MKKKYYCYLTNSIIKSLMGSNYMEIYKLMDKCIT